MSKVIKISAKVHQELESLKHPGQSYDGIIRELLQRLEELKYERNSHS